jgi:capsular polysaccharide transport system permease protein
LNTSAISPLQEKATLICEWLKNRYEKTNKLFRWIVIFPTVLAIIYFGCIVSDVYISESRFVVRTAEQKQNFSLGSILQSSGVSHASEDTWSVHDFILSRDALEKINHQSDLRQVFGDRNIDVFSRFAGFSWTKTFEALFHYYQKHISIEQDPTSSISVLKVMAFTAEDAHRINEILLRMSEDFVNKLNERARIGVVRFATHEVEVAEKKAKEAALAVSNYRIQKGVFDPERQSGLQLQQISKLQDELIATQTQLAQIRSFTPKNPQVASLEKHSEALKAAINSETSKVTGPAASLTNKATEYERLVLERDFAAKQLVVALASLEQARNEAQRQQIYLERIAEPNKPDVAMEPQRIKAILATLLLSLIIYGIASLLMANIREHVD